MPSVSSSFSSVESPRRTRACESWEASISARVRLSSRILTVVLLDRLRQAETDVAAPGDHDPPHRPVGTPQLAHDLADVHRGGEAEHLVTRQDDGVAPA